MLLQTDKINTIPIFNELANDYWLTDYLSFGFTSYIRRKAIKLLNPQRDEIICDAMCGTGNNFKVLVEKNCRIIAIDNAPKMIDLVMNQKSSNQITIRAENFLENTL